MAGRPAIVLGGGLSGLAAAYGLARAGWTEVTILEASPAPGGLAGSFRHEGRFYPLGYHHILRRDATLLAFLRLIGALPAVRWRRVRMLFETDGGLYELGRLSGFLRFPLPASDKLRLVRLMLRTRGKRDWADWLGRSAQELVDTWGSPRVRAALFERLTRLKFELPCAEVSAAWLGARLHTGEGSTPLGYIPNTNWTTVLCEGVARLVQEQGVRVRTRARVATLHTRDDRVVAAELAGGERLTADVFVSTLPVPTYLALLPDATPPLASIRYTALISLVCATGQRVAPEFYWLNLTSLGRRACAIFQLNALNPTIGAPGETCLNFVTHLGGAGAPFFRRSDGDLLAAYLDDFRSLFGFELRPSWTHVSRIAMYSPVFDREYRNPPVRSRTWPNVYFAGNYRTFPSVASTGTALASGLEAAGEILAGHGHGARLRRAA